MDTVLFNFHDLALILTAFECLLFALLLFLTREEPTKPTLFFIGILLCHVFIPMHELTFWGKQFRLYMLDISPNVFFSGSYAYFVDGPLLYFFVRSMLFKDFRLNKLHLLHVLPLAIYFGHMLFSFYLLPYEQRHSLVETQHIAYSAPYLYFDAAGRFLRVAYACACLMLVVNYQEQLKNYFANDSKLDIAWLNTMVVSFLGLFVWDAGLLIVKLWGLAHDDFDLDLLNVLGLTAYYLTFIVLNLLIFLKFTRFTKVSSIKMKPSASAKPDSLEDVSHEEISGIDQKMLEERIYRDSEINFDRLAQTLGIAQKKLSKILKHHYQMNFYEFINRFRIEDAKAMLEDPQYNNLTIVDIYCEVGFNSKSVFNTLFKAKVGTTPSQYRQQQQSAKGKKVSLLH